MFWRVAGVRGQGQEGPWLAGMATGDPQTTGVTMRLLLAHLTWNSKRLLGAMVLDRLDTELLSTGWILSTDLILENPCPGMVKGAFHPHRVNWVIRLTSPHLP